MKRIANILFDLDGTLTDSVVGIAGCIRYALQSMQLPCPSTQELATYVGPPLRDTFASICGSTDQETIEQAISLPNV